MTTSNSEERTCRESVQRNVRSCQAGNRISVARKLLYSCVVVLGFFGFLELSLRGLNLGRPPILGQLRFGYDTGIPVYDSDGIENEGEVFLDSPLFEQDDFVLWKPIANTPFTGPRGYRKPEPIDHEAPQGSLTIVVMGDSCSFLGKRPYPARLAELLNGDETEVVRVYNASCPGYSTEQGVVQLDAVKPLQPDLVVVYYGWNDHWNSLNDCTDRELLKRMEFGRKAYPVLGQYRTYWLARSFIPGRRPPATTNYSTVRVPLREYEENLRAMAKEFERWDCRGVFVTAPTSFVDGALPSWAYDFFAHYYHMNPRDIDKIPQTHSLYNATTREVMNDFEHCIACDLEEAFAQQPNLFRSDSIHLSEAGHQLAAQCISESIRQFDLPFASDDGF